MSVSEVAIKVAVRVRPFSRREMVGFVKAPEIPFVEMPFEFVCVSRNKIRRQSFECLTNST